MIAIERWQKYANSQYLFTWLLDFYCICLEDWVKTKISAGKLLSLQTKFF
ncbi:hypothetical protein FDUTEX481_01431 [Tolypothrix sp. PCC 7601]|nr:hypothetical protein FDUTEX481_01431 [Tolypothrix sp. PCC 7601]